MVKKRICIIGAGAAGLCAANLCKQDFLVEVFEKQNAVGGTWIYTEKTSKDLNQPLHSSMYQNLSARKQNPIRSQTCSIGERSEEIGDHGSSKVSCRNKSSKEVMMFPDFPFPEEGPSFIHHTEVLKYLHQYADYFQLYKYIKEGVGGMISAVLGCAIHAQWDLGLGIELANSSEQLHGFGEKCRPHQPYVDGHYHPLEESFLPFPMLEASHMPPRSRPDTSVQSGHYSIPHWPMIPGLSEFPGQKLHSHDYRNNSHFEGQEVVVVGAGPSGIDIAIEIAQVAKKVILSHNKVLSSPFPSNLYLESELDCIKDNVVYFKNGNSHYADSILVCTGYQYDFPFLDPSCRIKIRDTNIVWPLYKHIINVFHPTMAFIGIPSQIPPFPFFYQQIKFFLSAIEEKMILPQESEMLQDIDDNINYLLNSGLPEHHAHKMPSPILWEYDDDISKMASIKPISQKVRELYEITSALRKKNLLSYKDHNFNE
ncbi:hypothetical protein LAZ67_X003868 [Cordylochernes scorpioides]|uniref:Flavin-containing monooxygenase n=1 Tax=Cordylochernes scorpioides TaxID=51811 RepID=A0ABY6LUE4_9ARAC|nr:hypothetical protein LAZ67_X003868 [Cordylochernes scorpioides]